MATREVLACRLALASPFVELCKAGSITPAQALQRLLDELSIYAHLAPKDSSVSSAAMVLFQQYLQWRTKPQDPLDHLAEHYVRQLLVIVQDEKRKNNRERDQQLIIRKWYDAWWPKKTDQLRLYLNKDAVILQRLFHISLADFLQYYIDQLSINAITNEFSDTNVQLAVYFFFHTDVAEEA